MSKALAAWFMITTATAAPVATPRDTVQSATTRVVAVLQEAQLNKPDAGEGRGRGMAQPVGAEIRRVAADVFDFDEMARRTLSQHWAKRSPAERSELAGFIADLLERSYLGRVTAYAGEKIVYTSETTDGDYATVRSKVVAEGRPDTAVAYQLLRKDGRWKVYDVLVDGVSFVSTYRGEFNRVIQSASYGALIERLKKSRAAGLVATGR
jgi:phospholipid transport system substrate-binding protein